MDGFEETIAALRAAVALVEPGGRQVAANDFAGRWGAEDLIVFVRDVAVGTSLPALGFRQTLRGARAWRQLVAAAAMAGSLFAVRTLLDDRFAGSTGDRLLGVAALVGAGGLVYFTVAWVIGAMDKEDILILLRRKKPA